MHLEMRIVDGFGIDRFGGLQLRVQPRLRLPHIGLARQFVQPRHGYRPTIIPVEIEGLRHFRDHRPGQQHFEIREFRRRPDLVVFVRNIAPADNGDRPVGRKRLVMHAAIDAPETGHQPQRFRSRSWGRVKDAQLQIWMRIHQTENIVAHRGKDVIDEKAHAHAPVRGLQQRLHDQPPGQIRLHQKVLQVQCMLGLFDNPQTRTERFIPADQRGDRAVACRVLSGQRTDRPPQTGRRRRGQRTGHRFRCIERYGRATQQDAIGRRERAQASQTSTAAWHLNGGPPAVVSPALQPRRNPPSAQSFQYVEQQRDDMKKAPRRCCGALCVADISSGGVSRSSAEACRGSPLHRRRTSACCP